MEAWCVFYLIKTFETSMSLQNLAATTYMYMYVNVNVSFVFCKKITNRLAFFSFYTIKGLLRTESFHLEQGHRPRAQYAYVT